MKQFIDQNKNHKKYSMVGSQFIEYYRMCILSALLFYIYKRDTKHIYYIQVDI